MKAFHKIMALIARAVLGLTFIFSGFVKAVDPLGTVYKIQDYLEAFGMTFFNEYAVFFSFVLFSFELVLGLTLLFGSWPKVTSWCAMIFCAAMTVLTFVLALTNPVSDCGCFGDAVILTNWQTFEKNIILLILSLLLLLYKDELYHLFGRKTRVWAALLSLAIPVGIGLTAYRHLPLIDFRPYKIGTYLQDNMVIPEGAPLDSTVTEYIYEKNGVQQSFTLANYPAGDTAWHFVDRKEWVARKGYEPPIHDFEMLHPEYGDITDMVLTDTAYTFLWVAYKLEKADRSCMEMVQHLQQYVMDYGYTMYGLTSSTTEIVDEWVYEYDLAFEICSMDEIALKTMIRSNPGLILLKNGTVCNKWASRDIKRMEKDFDKPVEAWK